jgi:hypothetical protein
MRRYRVPILWSLLALGVITTAVAFAADKEEAVEKFSAIGVHMGKGRSSRIDIVIRRWSTDEEREKLLTTLQEFGQAKLVDALTEIRPTCGYLRLPNTMGYELYFARNNVMPDGSRHVVLATNRYVTMGEVATAQRSQQYTAAVIEIHMPKEGKGEGKIQPAAKVKWDNAKKVIEIENYGAYPIDLKGVQSVKP